MICPFTGKNCTEKPVIHVTDISNGIIETTHMCQNCGTNYMETVQASVAAKMNKKPEPKHNPNPNPAAANLTKFINSVDQLFELLGKKSGKKKKKKVPDCPKCGLSLSELYKAGRYGCPNCYDHFAFVLEESGRSLHDIPINTKIEHTGKRPKRLNELTLQDTIKLLKAKLAYAIEHEKYEEAAKIKQEIQDLEKVS